MTNFVGLLSGLPLGAVLGFSVKSLVDALSRRAGRQHDKDLRLLQTAVEAATAFLSAAEQTARRNRAFAETEATLEGLVPPEQGEYDPFWEEGQQTMRGRWLAREEASTEAEQALTTLYLLMPEVGDPANDYLRLCRSTGPAPDPSEQTRQTARNKTEDLLKRRFKIQSLS